MCSAIGILAKRLISEDLQELMANFGTKFREMADDPQTRWLGPHRGVVHLALASITNACFDLWAKARREPLWKVLLGLSPEVFVNLLDLSFLEDVLDRETAIRMLREQQADRERCMGILKAGYPGYDTSVGWYSYNDAQIRDNVQRSLDHGFGAFKLKVGGLKGAGPGASASRRLPCVRRLTCS